MSWLAFCVSVYSNLRVAVGLSGLGFSSQTMSGLATSVRTIEGTVLLSARIRLMRETASAPSMITGSQIECDDDDINLLTVHCIVREKETTSSYPRAAS